VRQRGLYAADHIRRGGGSRARITSCSCVCDARELLRDIPETCGGRRAFRDRGSADELGAAAHVHEVLRSDEAVSGDVLGGRVEQRECSVRGVLTDNGIRRSQTVLGASLGLS
jgi:hypothetical protein